MRSAVFSVLSCLFIGLLAAPASAQSRTQTLSPVPSYSNLSAAYTNAKLEGYKDNPTDVAFRIEQAFTDNLYFSGQYLDLSTDAPALGQDIGLEDFQLGVGWFERSDVGPYADTSILIGRETQHTPAAADPSEYIGLQIGLREMHGPVEVQTGIAYMVHNGSRDDQFRWHISTFIHVTRNLSVGLRYQDNDDYQLRSVEFRLRW
ncbi:hypothetical protein ACR0ST_03350 [Aliidiomarina sp. Khilg15.8]